MSGIPLRAIPDKYDKRYARIENAGSVPGDFDANYVSFSGYVGPYSAHLFAAAPDLLAALQDLEGSFEKHRPKAMWDAARAAIAKANGGAA